MTNRSSTRKPSPDKKKDSPSVSSPASRKKTVTLRLLKTEYVEGLLRRMGESVTVSRDLALKLKKRIPEAFAIEE